MNKLKLIGKIMEAPEEVQKGSYHSIEVGIGKMFSVEKIEWKEEKIGRLKRSESKIEFLKNPKDAEEFYVHLNKNDGLAMYGIDQIKMAALIGAVKTVFILEEKIRSEEVEELIEEIFNKKGEVIIVSKKYPVGLKFSKTYDIAAILRFPIA